VFKAQSDNQKWKRFCILSSQLQYNTISSLVSVIIPNWTWLMVWIDMTNI